MARQDRSFGVTISGRALAEQRFASAGAGNRHSVAFFAPLVIESQERGIDLRLRRIGVFPELALNNAKE